LTQFSDLDLSAGLLRTLAAGGYDTPTPIQAQAIPPALAGRDIAGIAQTGTGKTAAFTLPILDRLAPFGRRPRRGARVLILAPTRELSNQIADSVRKYGEGMRPVVTTVFGGVPIPRQERALANGVDILVATPGRLLDLIDRGALSLAQVEVLVLDEADQMLDLGFIHALRRIVPMLPRQRQTLFFSATMPPAIAELSRQYLTDPIKVAVTPQATTAERVTQQVMFVEKREKPALLAATLQSIELDQAIVFTRTKHGADKVVRQLAAAGIEAQAIHGNKSQPQRERTLAAFRNKSLHILVATDIAARGIDVPGVSHVINYELPNVPEQYVHRIGRTARAGADGLAISLCDSEERSFLRDIERLTRIRLEPRALPAGLQAIVKAHDLAMKAAPQPIPEDREERRHHHGRRGEPHKPHARPHAREDGGRDRRHGQGGPVANPLRDADRQPQRQGERPSAGARGPSGRHGQRRRPGR
jgi:ATP-dependent RNA helicase RhlE